MRYNVGARSPWAPRETLERLLEMCGGRRLWVDLKGRQLRIVQWAVPTFGDIVLNHALDVELPATLVLRGGEQTRIVAVRGTTVYVDPPPSVAVGQGQAVNVHGRGLAIHGYLTEEDEAYLAACRELGLLDVMLSFVEGRADVEAVRERLPGARCVLKIESPRGLDFVRDATPADLEGCQLMAARDDLLINIEPTRVAILPALELIVRKDPEAICASRLFAGLESGKDGEPSLGDLADLRLMEQLGYRHFLLSDGLCQRRFAEAMRAWEDYLALGEDTPSS